MKKVRFLFMILAAAVLISGNGLTAFAQTVSENQPIEETVSGNILEVNSVSGDEIQADRENPENPVHYCDEIVQRDFVYFGSWPQSEVTDSSLIAAIEAAIQNGGKKSEDGVDVWLNGTKYRRISKENVTNNSNFGNANYRYFKWERIKWKVLDNDGAGMLLMADKALDCKQYFSSWPDVFVWENSSLRVWLNGSFYQTAFSDRERSAIMKQKLSNEKDPYGKGGDETQDNIFMLSAADVMNGEYGFESRDGNMSRSRLVKSSEFATAMGTYTVPDSERPYYGLKPEEYHGNCSWWLRTPGKEFNGWMMYVSERGSVINTGSFDDDLGIVPVLCLLPSSKSWLMTDDGTSGDGGENRVLTSLKANKTKIVYQIGEVLKTDDLHVTACYEKHAEKPLSAGSYSTNAASVDMNTPGNKTLTISYTESGKIKTAAISITVENIKITGPSKKLAAGKKVLLTCKNTLSNTVNSQVTWKSSNKKYASVDKNGKVSLKKAGAGKNVTITATAPGKKAKAVYKIKIMKDSVKSIKLNASKKTLKAGKSFTIKATVKTTGRKVNKTLKWTSSNAQYATVSKKGKVTAKKAGKGKTVTITAASVDGSNKKASIKLKIK